jgi:arginyl-tRNA synthetase
MISSVTKIYFTNDDGTQSSTFANQYKVVWESGEEWFVPVDLTNTHYQQIQEWIAEGNTPEEAE